MKIELPDHEPGPWHLVPWWLGKVGDIRRRNWRWTVDHFGCRCVEYWEYRKRSDQQVTPEGRVKAMVNKGLADLTEEGSVWKFMPVQNGMGIPGLDYFLCVGGRWVAIETKTKGKKLTPRQEKTKADIEKARGVVLIVDDAQSCATAMQLIRGLAGWGIPLYTQPADAADVRDPYTGSYTPAED